VVGSQPGLRINRATGKGLAAAPASFTCTVERRDRSIYFSALRNGERENFFGAVITAAAVEQPVSLSHVAAGDGVLEVALQGVTLTAHRVRIELNSTDLGEIAFAGQAPAVARFNLPQATLQEGQNTVRLIALSGPSDVSLVDYLRLSYERSYTADNLLKFTAAANQSVTINGFSAPAIRVIDVTDANAPQEVSGAVKRQADGYAITLAAPAEGERTLLAFINPQPPAGLSLQLPSNLRKGNADYLILTRRELADRFRPLIAQRQGLSVSVIDVEDIYDEFNFGNKSPFAIREFLSHAASNWKKKPRFVLLAGDASYDPRNYLGRGDFDLVPTKLVDTDFMETASDDWLSDFNGDDIADLATGRLPVRSVDEADLLVGKILA
jgi:hypothetical protein